MQEMQETKLDSWVRMIPLEKEMATHSSVPAWEILWTQESAGLQTRGSKKGQMWLSTDYHIRK